MDIIEFEKAYAELIARGIDPSEFGRWLISFDERHPYAPVVSPLRPLREFVYVYEGFEDKRFYRDVELSGIRIADGLTLSTNMQLWAAMLFVPRNMRANAESCCRRTTS